MTSELPFRPCVGMMVYNREGRVFVGARLDNVDDAWQMPQGGIDEGEDPEAAALRELREEIGTDKVEIITRTRGWLKYDLPDALMGKMWGGRYRGQKQLWYLMRFTGTDRDINIETDHQEFRTWEWAEIGSLTTRIVPFKRDLYKAVIDELAPQIALGTDQE